MDYVLTDGTIGSSSAYDWIRHSWVLKIWYKYQQESPAQGGLTFTMNTVTLC